MTRASDTFDTVILGGGVTGLAAGAASGAPVFEARETLGGICASYYIRPGERLRLPQPPETEEAYRFEYGGGHWIFGGDPTVLRFIESLTPTQRSARRSSVYFPDRKLFVPYPIQDHLTALGPAVAAQALSEMASPAGRAPSTMAEWLEQYFGKTLTELFFAPFHERYTAGLWTRIAPQDGYKSPVHLPRAIQGAFSAAAPVGYNTVFRYPQDGLNALVQRLASRCTVFTRKTVTAIDPKRKVVAFADGTSVRYQQILSTLPLHVTGELAGCSVEARPDPYTSVLVVNLGGRKGPRCPADHWVYVPRSDSGFHRVGFYSNVDASFLPRSARRSADRVSLYAEQAFLGGARPAPDALDAQSQRIVKELQAWGFLGDVEVVDPTWIDVAYTWSWPGSRWVSQLLERLHAQEIYPVGRYGRWIFQGIADSIRDGLMAGAAFSRLHSPRAPERAARAPAKPRRLQPVRAGR